MPDFDEDNVGLFGTSGVSTVHIAHVLTNSSTSPLGNQESILAYDLLHDVKAGYITSLGIDTSLITRDGLRKLAATTPTLQELVLISPKAVSRSDALRFLIEKPTSLKYVTEMTRAIHRKG
jgi:hypothetical protein